MATYIVGDIHGCFREWIRFKSKIEKQDAEAEFILVGDILDKGPNSFEMLQWAMERVQFESKYQMVIGNHEAEKLKWLKYVLNDSANEGWRNQESARRMLSVDGYEFYKICCEKNLNRKQLKEIMNWLETLPEYIEKEVATTEGIQKFVITHHKLQSNKNVITNAEYQAEKDMFPKNKHLSENQNCIIIHGHFPTTLETCKNAGAIPGKVWIQNRNINVDCGLVYGVSKSQGLYGDLAAIRLEDMQEFYYYNHVVEI